MTTIYIIVKCANSVYVTCFLNKAEAEAYVFQFPFCCIRHEVKDA